jgi:hypothetical protein
MGKVPPPKPQPKTSSVPPPKPRPPVAAAKEEPEAFVPPKSRSQPKPVANHPHAEPDGSGEATEILSPYEIERRHQRGLMACCIALSIGMVMAIPAVLLAFAAKPSPKIIAVTPTLQVMQLPALNQPFISDSEVADWAASTVIKTVSLGFAYYKQQLSDVQSDYTPPAFAKVYKSLNDNDLLPTMIQDRFDITAALTQSPLVEAEGYQGGVYTWKIGFPVILNLQDTNGSNPSRQYLVTVLVRRVSVAFNPRGVAIEQLVISQTQ